MRTLLPGEWIDGDIINMYADYKNMKEAEKDVTSPRCWFLPTYYSLASLDFVLRQEARALFGNRFSFLNFQIYCQAGLPKQPNGFDCGYYVMKYMDSPCIVVHDSDQHDSDHARLLLALYLVQSPLNKIRRRLIQEARKL
ncbi:uncharacterized protein LOC112097185 isoform X1 [Citrus clementina]|uniref:uncharacterized protein LOC112097185 isoform X1 n=2 Tax=Citrus clementina TaxID=85681 RepID=UPI000CED15CE|nr:uncharacterized protein LOC112097185 isoform X1 [Citrus x clementina]